MDKSFFENVILAFATGDSSGKATEAMTKDTISEKVRALSLCPGEEIIDPRLVGYHGNLPHYAVTDDTEQVCYLLSRYRKDGVVTPENTASELSRWIEETEADKKGYIGPSSKKALDSIKNGGDIREAGKGGTTCGGIMRVLSAVLFSIENNCSLIETEKNVVECLLPTHYTSQALESAMSYTYAFLEAIKEESTIDSILDEAIKGANRGLEYAPWLDASPLLSERIKFLRGVKDEDLDNILYSVLGCNLPSYDTASAVFGIFMHSTSLWDAIVRATLLGGDTDTIAALTGALSYAYYKVSDIPEDIIENIRHENKDLLGKVGL